MTTKWIVVDTESCPKEGFGKTDPVSGRPLGQSPLTGVMVCFGATELVSKETFYGELFPWVPDPEIPAMPMIVGRGLPKKVVCARFVKWLESFRADRLVFVSDNNSWDSMWMNYFFEECNTANPFGFSGRRIGDFHAGLTTNWLDNTSWKRYRLTKHTHKPDDDALGNAEALERLLRDAGQWDVITGG